MKEYLIDFGRILCGSEGAIGAVIHWLALAMYASVVAVMVEAAVKAI